MDITTNSIPLAVNTYKAAGATPWKSKVKYDRKCFSCWAMGHISYDCPKGTRLKKCTGCGSDQHTRGQCKDNSSTTNGPNQNQGLQVEIGRISHSHAYIKNIEFNGVQLEGLIDTGCSVCLIRSSAAIQCNLLITPAKQPLYVVGDMNKPRTTTVGKGNGTITINGLIGKNHEVLVVTDNSIPNDLLIGRTWLDLPQVNYFKHKNDFVIEPLTMDLEAMKEVDGSPLEELKVCLVDTDRLIDQNTVGGIVGDH